MTQRMGRRTLLKLAGSAAAAQALGAQSETDDVLV